MHSHEHLDAPASIIDEVEIPTIDEYIDNAKIIQDFTSDRQLAKALGVAPSVVNNWHKGKNWPSDYMMKRLAELSGAYPDQALLALNFWRAPNRVKPNYARLMDVLNNSLKQTAAALLIGAIAVTSAPILTGQSANNSASICTEYTLCGKSLACGCC